jgi:glucose/sorbosone dehydrogenase
MQPPVARLTALTGLGAFEWLLVGLFAVGLVLVVESRTKGPDGLRVRGFLLVPALSGLVVCLALPLAYGDGARLVVERMGDRAWSIAVALLALVTGVAFADFLLGRLTRVASALVRRLPIGRWGGDLALLLGVALPVGVALLATPVAERHVSSAEDEQPRVVGRASVRATFELPGHPMDIVFRTSSSGYVSFGEGSIARFDLPGDEHGELQLTTVATGLEFPRGIALREDTLFVAELGPLPCDPSFPVCQGFTLNERFPEAGERKIVRSSRGRVLAFHVDEDGALTDRRVVLADLPFATTEHGVNDVVLGPDGRIFVAIGNVDLLYATPSFARELRRPHGNLLGTVISFEPDGSGLRVYARGLRNVYGLAFDDNGRLYGVDNDGPTQGSWRREEVLEISRGADYGYPSDGTYAPYLVPRDPPLWVLDIVGSGGLAWVRRQDGGSTLYIGSGAHLSALTLEEGNDGRLRVHGREDESQLLELPGYVTALQPMAGGLAVAVYAFPGTVSAEQSHLYLIDVEER